MRCALTRVIPVVLVAGGLATGAVGTGSMAAATPTAAAREGSPSGAITVFAASSLTEVFTAMGRAFERQHSETTITFSFSASSSLAPQIDAGAPADVFASADETDVEQVEDSVRGSATVFARNRLAIAVEPDNPLSIRTLADTTEPDVLLVLCASKVPCGALARKAYRRAGVPVPVVASAENVKAALTTVVLGEADAAVVYATDVRAADGSVDGVRIPKHDNVVARYPIAVLQDAENPRLARAFVRFVRSDTGARVLHDFGFLAP